MSSFDYLKAVQPRPPIRSHSRYQSVYNTRSHCRPSVEACRLWLELPEEHKVLLGSTTHTNDSIQWINRNMNRIWLALSEAPLPTTVRQQIKKSQRSPTKFGLCSKIAKHTYVLLESLITPITKNHSHEAKPKPDVSLRSISKTSRKSCLQELSTPVSCAVDLNELEVEESQALKEITPEESVHIKIKNRKHSAEVKIKEHQPQRRRNLSTHLSKVSPVHPPSKSFTSKTANSPKANGNTGYFSAWGIEDDEKEADNVQSVKLPCPMNTAIVEVSSHQTVPNSSEIYQNSSTNTENQKEENLISPSKSTQSDKVKTEKYKTFVTRGKQRADILSGLETQVKAPNSTVLGDLNICIEVDTPKSPEKKWTCDTCLVSNKALAERCEACETPKYGVGMKRLWIPPVVGVEDLHSSGRAHEEISQSNDLSTNVCGFENGRLGIIQNASVAAISMASVASSVSQMTCGTCPVTEINSVSDTSPLSSTGARTTTGLVQRSAQCSTSEENVPSSNSASQAVGQLSQPEQKSHLSQAAQLSQPPKYMLFKPIEVPSDVQSPCEQPSKLPEPEVNLSESTLGKVERIKPSSWMASASTSTAPDGKLPGNTAATTVLHPAKTSHENACLGRGERRKSVREDGDSLDPDEPVAKRCFRLQDSSITTSTSLPSMASFPAVFGLPTYSTTSSNAAPPAFCFGASNKSDMNTGAMSYMPSQALPFAFGHYSELGSNNTSSAGTYTTSASNSNFTPVFGQMSSALSPAPFNLGMANASIPGNPVQFSFAGPGFQFSGNLVPNFNFGCSSNNAVFRFGANESSQSTTNEGFNFAPLSLPTFTTGTPRQLNTQSASSISHRKIKTAVRKRR
eukprot:gi/632976181/ref/XP_007904653.1/ PREDICTED: nuclear pore complex protein Nup153-like [Callorhinchus milii]